MSNESAVESLDAGRPRPTTWRSSCPWLTTAKNPLSEETEEPELSAEQQLEQQLAQLQLQAHEQGYNAGLAEGRQKGHEQGYQEGLSPGAGARPEPERAVSACADPRPHAATGERVSELRWTRWTASLPRV